MADKKRLENIKSFISDIIAQSFSEELESDTGKGKNEEVVAEFEPGNVYESIEDYSQKTGKRFRMTKEQKERELSRDAAFEEFIQENTDV